MNCIHGVNLQMDKGHSCFECEKASIDAGLPITGRILGNERMAEFLESLRLRAAEKCPHEIELETVRAAAATVQHAFIEQRTELAVMTTDRGIFAEENAQLRRALRASHKEIADRGEQMERQAGSIQADMEVISAIRKALDVGHTTRNAELAGIVDARGTVIDALRAEVSELQGMVQSQQMRHDTLKWQHGNQVKTITDMAERAERDAKALLELRAELSTVKTAFNVGAENLKAMNQAVGNLRLAAGTTNKRVQALLERLRQINVIVNSDTE